MGTGEQVPAMHSETKQGSPVGGHCALLKQPPIASSAIVTVLYSVSGVDDVWQLTATDRHNSTTKMTFGRCSKGLPPDHGVGCSTLYRRSGASNE